MEGWLFNLLILLAATSCSLGNSIPINSSSLVATEKRSSSLTVDVCMDDPKDCGNSEVDYFRSYQLKVYVSAWGLSDSHTPPADGCVYRYGSYSNYGMKYKFLSGDYISDCGVTLKIYDSSSTSGIPLVCKRTIF